MVTGGDRRPAYDPELSAWLAAAGPFQESFAVEDIPELRSMPVPDEVPVEQLILSRAVVYEQHRVPVDCGADHLAASVFRPARAVEPGPCIYFTHGGGMILGDRHSNVELLLDWVEAYGVTAVTVDYRLAPEHPFPTPQEDCYAGLLWAVENAIQLGIDVHQLVVAGVSAGGGLAASLALMSLDRGGPPILAQLLICPMLDDRDDTPSTRQFEAGIWNRSNNRVGWSALLEGRAGSPGVSPYAAPARALDLGELPPAYLEVGSAEVFREEDVAYASKLWEAGVQAELHVWPGGFHCFWQVEHAAVSRAAAAARNEWLGRVLGVAEPAASHEELLPENPL